RNRKTEEDRRNAACQDLPHGQSRDAIGTAAEEEMASGIRAGEPAWPGPVDGLVERGGYVKRGAVAVRDNRGGGRLRRQAQNAVHDHRAASAHPESEKLRR